MVAFWVLLSTSILLMVGVIGALRYPAYAGVMAATGLSYLAVLTTLGAVFLGRALVSWPRTVHQLIGASMEMRVASSDIDLTDTTLIVGVMEDLEVLTNSELVGEVDRDAVIAGGFEGKKGQFLRLPHPTAAALLLVGLGEEVSFHSIRSASGDAARKVKTERAVTLLAQAAVDGATRAVVEGSVLGGYQFRTYKTDEDALDLVGIDVVGADEEALDAAVIASVATTLARDWVNTPARDKAPEHLASLMAHEATEVGLGVGGVGSPAY